MSEKEVAREKKKTVKGTPPGGRARPPSQGAHSSADRLKKKPYRPAPYPYELRRRAVRLYLEEGIPALLVAQELGISDTVLYGWVQRYRAHGEEGLRDRPCSAGKSRLPEPVKEKIIALKRENPAHGPKRLSQILRRFFFLKASPTQVSKHLKRAALVLPKAKARRKPKAPERRFERSTPNQMWQSDITYFPILGKTAYIIGFIDDYSRYITGLGVYRSHTGEFVLETYRSAVAEYGVPKEMLTDNGRQYANWRGKTRFQKELEKDHVLHIRSAPQHPETPGEDRTVLEDLERGVPGTRPVRDFRGGAGAHRLLGEILQPQADPPGTGRAVPGGSVLLHPEGVEGNDRERGGGQHRGNGAARKTRAAVLHGGPDGR